MRGLMVWLLGMIAGVIREVNRANAVMRVPELRVHHSGPPPIRIGGRCRRA